MRGCVLLSGERPRVVNEALQVEAPMDVAGVFSGAARDHRGEIIQHLRAGNPLAFPLGRR